MAVTYMKKLEEEPETYDEEFTQLTKGINIEVQEWILDHINKSESVLEVGCGTGHLAQNIADKGCKVLAIDKNPKMIKEALRKNQDNNVKFQVGTIDKVPIEKSSKDSIITTFMLSELRPLESQIFLREAWMILKKNGKLIIAAEFEPDGFWKIPFKIKRWWYRKKLRKHNINPTLRSSYFFQYLRPIGFKINEKKIWDHGSIQVLELTKIEKENNKPGFYRPPQKDYKGMNSQLRIYRCLLTGQIDNVSIEPGIYVSGNPDRSSPIIVTSNYEYTYIKVMRDLDDINAWVLCIDSNGINVWCAARGNDFGNKQLIEAVMATGIEHLTTKRTLILPQLSAGGVSAPQLPKKSQNFPFKVKYGPVWSKYLPEYLEKKPEKKPPKMKVAKFSRNHRLRAGFTHLTFLLRKICLIPLLILSGFFLLAGFPERMIMIYDVLFAIIIGNLIIAVLFPITSFTNDFIRKGLLFGSLISIIIGGINILYRPLFYIFLLIPFYFWISFFSTMSFSGYTMTTNPRIIQEQYPRFKKINRILLFTALFTSIVNFFINF